MKKHRILFGTLIVIGLAGCNQAPPAPAAPPDTKAKDIADIKALEDKFMAAWKAKDVNAIMSCYVPDDSLLVFDVVPPRQYSGAAAYRKDWEETVAMFPGPLDAAISDVDVTVGGGDVAFGHSVQHFSGTMKDGKKFEATVRVTDGYKRVNGQWLIAHEHVSVPVDFPSGKSDLMSKP